MTAVEWRGRLDEQPDDLPIDEAIPLRREARALLGNLLRPYRMTLGLLAVVVIAENMARLSVPLLVQRGIDTAIPPLLVGGSAGELTAVVVALGVLAVVQADIFSRQ
jgi:ABC-type multidrug transport system fused ATPase/permease subunit